MSTSRPVTQQQIKARIEQIEKLFAAYPDMPVERQLELEDEQASLLDELEEYNPFAEEL